jgi:hypothetical protein
MEIKELYKKFLKAKGIDPKHKNLVAGKKIEVSKKGLWDKSRKQVIVPSNRITMKGPNGEQDFFKKPVVATGLQSGQKVMMQPGGEYYFPNDKAVHEVRMQKGGKVPNKKPKLTSDNPEYTWKGNDLYYKPKHPRAPVLPPIKVNKLNPTLEEVANTLGSDAPIDATYKNTKNRLVLPSSNYENQLIDQYIKPQVIGKKFGTLPLNQGEPIDEGYSKHRIWAQIPVSSMHGDSYLNSYFLEANKEIPGYTDVDYSSGLETLPIYNQQLADHIPFVDKEKNADKYVVKGNTWFSPENSWNRSRQLSVEMQNNPEIKEWAKLHNVDLGSKPRSLDREYEVESGEFFAPRLAEQMLANRNVNKGEDIALPPLRNYERLRVIQNPDAFNLVGYANQNEIDNFRTQYQKENNIQEISPEQEYKFQKALFNKLDIKADPAKTYIHFNRSPLNEYTPGMQDGGTIQTDITSPIRQKASATQDAFNAMLSRYETSKATPEADASNPEDMGFQSGGDVPVVIDALFSNFAKKHGKKYAQMGMNNVGAPEDETPVRPADLPPLPQDAGKFNQWLYNKADTRQKRLQAEFDVKDAADKEIKYVNNPKYADLLTAEFYGPEKTYDDLDEEEAAKMNDIIANRRSNLKNINLVSADLTKKGIKAGYDPNLHTMYVPKTPTDRGVHSHEFSHVGDQAMFDESVNPGVGTYFQEQIKKSMYPKESSEFLNQPSSLKLNQTIGGNKEQDFNEAEYLQDPSEVKARLRALRDSSIQQGYKLLEPGYDINKYKKGFNKEEQKQYDQLKSSGLSDDKINELMYLFAKNNTPNSVMAQKGAFIPYQSPRPFLRTSPAGNAGYSDNTRIVTPESNLTDEDRDRIAQIELAKRRGTITQGKKETAYEKAKRKSSFVEQEKERTGSASPISYVMDAVNPATYTFAATDLVGNTGSAVKNAAQGNFGEAGSDLLNAGINALTLVPVGFGAKGAVKPLSKFMRLSPAQYKASQTLVNSKIDKLSSGLNGVGDAINSQIYKNPKVSLFLKNKQLPESLDNITYSPGLKFGNVKPFDEYITSGKAGKKDISELAFFNRLDEGTASLDNSLKKRVSDLESPEGFNRLVNQEKEYLIESGTDASVAERVAKLNAKARVDELKNTTNINREATKYAKNNFLGGTDNKFVNNKSLYNNAYFDKSYNNTIEDKIMGKINLQKPVEDYSKSKPGGIGTGYNFINNKPIEMHEIAHGLQRGRKLPIDNELRQLTPKKNLYGDTENAYNYFKKGSKGQESSAFANELRESMLQKGFIPDYYSPISEQQVQNAYKYFKKNPMGVYDKSTGQFLSNTRIFDFMAPTKTNSKILTEVLNKLPAAVPVGAGVGLGASQLNKKASKFKSGGIAEINPNTLGFQMGGMSIPGVNGSVVANTNAPSLYKKYKKK